MSNTYRYTLDICPWVFWAELLFPRTRYVHLRAVSCNSCVTWLLTSNIHPCFFSYLHCSKAAFYEVNYPGGTMKQILIYCETKKILKQKERWIEIKERKIYSSHKDIHRKTASFLVRYQHSHKKRRVHLSVSYDYGSRHADLLLSAKEGS